MEESWFERCACVLRKVHHWITTIHDPVDSKSDAVARCKTCMAMTRLLRQQSFLYFELNKFNVLCGFIFTWICTSSNSSSQTPCRTIKCDLRPSEIPCLSMTSGSNHSRTPKWVSTHTRCPSLLSLLTRSQLSLSTLSAKTGTQTLILGDCGI